MLKPGGRFITVEILREPKLFLLMLFFAFVWSPNEHWINLIKHGGLENIKASTLKGLFGMGLFVAEKPK